MDPQIGLFAGGEQQRQNNRFSPLEDALMASSASTLFQQLQFTQEQIGQHLFIPGNPPGSLLRSPVPESRFSPPFARPALDPESYSGQGIAQMAPPQQESRANGKPGVAGLDSPQSGENINSAQFSDSESDDDEFDDSSEEMVHSKSGMQLWRALCTPIITVLVGPSERQFQLHCGLLRRHSLFFRHMLRSARFLESKTQIVRLPEDDITSFAVFAEWLYLGDECDTGAIFKSIHGKNVEAGNDESPDVNMTIPPYQTASLSSAGNQNVAKSGTAGADDGYDTEEESISEWETGSTADPLAVHDHYDFSLQFSCYVLADKLQAPGFKRLILEEIRMYGEFCDPAFLTAEHIRYAYENTARMNDPLRRFCIMLKCKRTPIQETLADPEFMALMEKGGPLVKDVMDSCRKQVAKYAEAED